MREPQVLDGLYTSAEDSLKVQIVSARPTAFEEVYQLINTLKYHHGVILSLHELSPETAQRMLDMLVGALYAMGGQSYAIDNWIYMLCPESFQFQPSNEAVMEESVYVGEHQSEAYLYQQA